MTDWQNIAVIGIGILVLGFSVRWIVRIERMSDVRVARKPNVRIASPGTRTRGVVPKNSAVIFLPITALFYSPKKIKIASILASKYLSMYPLSDGRLFTPCDLVYNLASFLNPF
mgnify:CR=1 FL=1